MSYEAPHSQTHISLAQGTLIDVLGGQTPVERLRVGDMVRTKDNGYQPVRWIASRTLDEADFRADPALRPIKISANAFGASQPSRALRVSQQHSVLLGDWRCEMLFGEQEVMAAVTALLNDRTVVVDYSDAAITYLHIMFDAPQVVFSNGIETACRNPSSSGAWSLDAAGRNELYTLFPELEFALDIPGPNTRASHQDFASEVRTSC